MEPFSSFVEVNTRQVLNLESDLVGTKEVIEACNTFIKAVKTILFNKKRVDRWPMAAILVPVQTFPVHIMSLVGNLYTERQLYMRACGTIRFGRDMTSDVDDPTVWTWKRCRC